MTQKRNKRLAPVSAVMAQVLQTVARVCIVVLPIKQERDTLSSRSISCTRGHLCGPEWGGGHAPRSLHFLLNSLVDCTGSTARMSSFWKVCSQRGPGLPKVTVPTHALRWPGIHWEAMMGEVSRWLCPFPKESCGPIFLERVHFYTYMVCTIFTSKKTWRAAYYVLNLQARVWDSI